MSCHVLSALPCATSLLFTVAFAACQPREGTELSSADRDRIIEEISRTLDDYGTAVTRKELSAIKRFWSDSDAFVFAGDGEILVGGYRAWYDRLDWYDQDTQRWTDWQWLNRHIEPLAIDAASATLDFDNTRINVAGDTLRVRGAWTYIFKNYGGSWRVIQTNGTHIPY